MEKQKRLLKALEHSFDELLKVMNKPLDVEEVDPEKMKTAASAYRLAADDAKVIMEQISHLEDYLKPKDVNKKQVFKGVEKRYGNK